MSWIFSMVSDEVLPWSKAILFGRPLLADANIKIVEAVSKVLLAELMWMEHGNLPFDWIGLREILQETIDFPIKYGAFL